MCTDFVLWACLHSTNYFMISFSTGLYFYSANVAVWLKFLEYTNWYSHYNIQWKAWIEWRKRRKNPFKAIQNMKISIFTIWMPFPIPIPIRTIANLKCIKSHKTAVYNSAKYYHFLCVCVWKVLICFDNLCFIQIIQVNKSFFHFEASERCWSTEEDYADLDDNNNLGLPGS